MHLIQKFGTSGFGEQGFGGGDPSDGPSTDGGVSGPVSYESWRRWQSRRRLRARFRSRMNGATQYRSVIFLDPAVTSEWAIARDGTVVVTRYRASACVGRRNRTFGIKVSTKFATSSTDKIGAQASSQARITQAISKSAREEFVTTTALAAATASAIVAIASLRD